MLSKAASSTIFWVFGMTRPEIELSDHWRTLYSLGPYGPVLVCYCGTSDILWLAVTKWIWVCTTFFVCRIFLFFFFLFFFFCLGCSFLFWIIFISNLKDLTTLTPTTPIATILWSYLLKSYSALAIFAISSVKENHSLRLSFLTRSN